MPKYALEFQKEGYMVYLSNLDMMELFRRVFRRTKLPLTFSQGFNPHPRMGMALPLSLGYGGKAEWLQFQLDEALDPAEIKERIAGAFPDGIAIQKVISLEGGKRNLTGEIIGAEYEIILPKDRIAADLSQAVVDDFLAQEEILIRRKRKKGKRKIYVTDDIKGLIESVRVEEGADKYIMYTKVTAGNQQNLSPDHLLSALADFLKAGIPREHVAITRLGLIFKEFDS